MRPALDMGAKQPRAGTDDEDMDDIDGEQEQYGDSRPREREDQPSDDKQGEACSWRRLEQERSASRLATEERWATEAPEADLTRRIRRWCNRIFTMRDDE
ncbi:hypothetical protein V3C99_006109 [Haemonchus contortus]